MSATATPAPADLIAEAQLRSPREEPADLPHAPTANKRSFRYESLDLWRGVACLSVVVYHSTAVYAHAERQVHSETLSWLSEWIMAVTRLGHLGVPMFFVISGYCIAATAISTQQKSTGLPTYVWRRVRRIYPPYWLAIAIAVLLFIVADVWLWPGVLSSEPIAQYRPWWFSPTKWLGNLTLTESWRHHFGLAGRGHILGQSWTLCYEEQFYAVVGLLLLFRSRAFFPLCAAITAACLGVQQVAHATGADISGFFFDGHWLSFAMGIAVFYALNYLPTAGQAIACGILLGGSPFLHILPGLEKHCLAFAAMFAVLLIVLRRWDERVKSVRWLWPLFVCGTMCYSLYLVHQLIVVGISRACYQSGFSSNWSTLLVTVPLCIVASLAAGWSFYWLVERKFLNPAVSRIKA